MLVLTRKVGETIRIGKDVVVTLVSVQRNGKAKIGIEAPLDTHITRGEIILRKHNAGS